MPVKRLDGLDLARFFAFVGMVIVNFKVVMGAGTEPGLLSFFTGALEGRAAATFVVLAGIGLGLSTARSDHNAAIFITLKRAAFLLAIGLLNSLIFDADIIHYYAFYFLFGVFFLPLSNRTLIGLTAFINVVFIILIISLDYDRRWNWTEFTYADFWTPGGFIRNLFFNGWHPVIPWVSFLLFGIVLARLHLGERSLQHKMITIGIAGYVGIEIVSAELVTELTIVDAELAILFGTQPVPPVPLYMLAGMSAAAAVIGVCLRISGWARRVGLLKIVTPAGRQTLTLYIAHILIGMGTLEAFGLLGNQTLPIAVLAAVVFCIAATIYAYLWSRIFKRGPIEAVMCKMAG